MDELSRRDVVKVVAGLAAVVAVGEVVLAEDGKQKKGPLSADRVKEITKVVKVAHESALDAIRKHDAKAVQTHFSEHFSTAGGDWQFASREAVVKALEGGDYKYKEIKSAAGEVRVVSETVVVINEKRTVKATIKGESFEADFKNKSVYVNEDGDWKVLLWAVTC